MFKVQLDVFGQLLVVIALVTLVYGITYPATTQLSLIAFVLTIGGISLGRLFNTLGLEGKIDRNDLIYGFIALGLLIVTNITVYMNRHLLYAQLPFPPELLLVMMAVAEEVFMRGFLFPYLFNLTGSLIYAMLGQSTIWTIYHFFVSNQDPYFLTIVFLSGIVLAFIDYKQQSLTPSLIAHVLNNLLVIV